jgi:DNA polymerase V
MANTTHGGKRPGAGRPPAAEKTAVIRIPEGSKPHVQALLAQYKNAPSSPADVLRPYLGAKILKLPLFAERVQAGFPSPATDYIEARLDLNQLMIQHAEATFFLRAKGLSMLGAGINDGDLLVVDRSINAAHGHVVIAVVDGEFTVKRLHQKTGAVHLISENPDYPNITFTDGQELQIWGVVTNVIHKL